MEKKHEQKNKFIPPAKTQNTAQPFCSTSIMLYTNAFPASGMTVKSNEQNLLQGLNCLPHWLPWDFAVIQKSFPTSSHRDRTVTFGCYCETTQIANAIRFSRFAFLQKLSHATHTLRKLISRPSAPSVLYLGSILFLDMTRAENPPAASSANGRNLHWGPPA